MDNPLVIVRSLVYNHEPYLRQCLDGFVMQKTNFIFEVQIHDDASTDNSAAIILEYAEKYPDIIKPYIEEENQYSKGSKGKWKWGPLNCKYIAICEGDDYWIDPLKLQKQVDFLESHPDYSCVFHRYMIHNEINEETYLSPDKYFDNPKHQSEYFYEFNNEYNLLVQWTSKTLTAMYRSNLYKENDLKQFKYRRDVHLFYYLMSKGRGACMSFIGGVYNKNPRSVFGSKTNIEQDNINRIIYKEFYNKIDDFLLKEKYYRHNDNYLYGTLSGFKLLLFRIRRKVRQYLTKNKRMSLLNRITPCL